MKKEDRERMAELRNEFENLPVPEEARTRMEQGILRAKKESGKDMNRGKIIHLFKSAGLSAACALVLLTVTVNISPTIANAMEDIPVVGEIAKVVTFRTYENKVNNFEAKVEVPQVTLGSNENPAVNKSIEQYADQLIKQYESDLAASNGEGNYSIDSTYDIVTDNDKYLCVRINTTLIMASGTEYVKIFTVDKATGETVSLSQIFEKQPDYIDKISDNIKQQMVFQMEGEEQKIYFYNNPDMEKEFQFNQITGEESFYFNGNGELVICFDEYQVAPGYMGAVEFMIPKDITGELVK